MKTYNVDFKLVFTTLLTFLASGSLYVVVNTFAPKFTPIELAISGLAFALQPSPVKPSAITVFQDTLKVLQELLPLIPTSDRKLLAQVVAGAQSAESLIPAAMAEGQALATTIKQGETAGNAAANAVS